MRNKTGGNRSRSWPFSQPRAPSRKVGTIMSFQMTTAEVSQHLRLSVSSIFRLRKQGVLKPGIHFRANGAGLHSPTLLWNPEAVDQALAMRSRRILA